MTKKGPLGKAETFYVKEHCSKQSAEEIAKDLDRPIVTVKNAIEKFTMSGDVTPKAGTAGSQMARRDGVTIMTENASAISDESPRKIGSKRSEDCIARIKQDD